MAKKLIALLGTLIAFAAFADWPDAIMADDGTYQCVIIVWGKSSSPYVDINSPSSKSTVFLAIEPRQRRVYLLVDVLTYDDDVNKLRQKYLTDMAGSTISYQWLDGREPVDLVLPLTWSVLQVNHPSHTEDKHHNGTAAFDITKSSLGEYLLTADDNPMSLAIKHKAIIDLGRDENSYRKLGYRIDNDTAKFSFNHFAQSKAYCDRANRGDEGEARWFDWF